MDGETIIHIGHDLGHGDYLSIAILGRSHPQCTDYWDGNWLSVEIEATTGGFKGRCHADLRCEELEKFGGELSKLYDATEGAAVFETMEGQLSLTLTRYRNGHVLVKGLTMDQAGIGNRLNFNFEIDQTFLPRIMRQLDIIASKFPTISRP